MQTLVFVDDEPNILKSLKRAVKREKWEVLTFENPEQALQELKHSEVDLIVSDYRMPQMTGVEFLKRFKESHPNSIRLILSGQADMAGVIGAMNEAEAYRFILKPWSDEELILSIRQALDYNRLQLENRRLADIVRSQQVILQKQQGELKRLEKESPRHYPS